jgi:glycosyltransferase involved in cell wall biosynthesis
MQPVNQLQSVAFVSPGWPAEAMANGVVSYVNTVTRALRELGVRSDVLTPQLLGPDVTNVHLIEPDVHSLLAKVMLRVAPEGWKNYSIARAMLREVRRLHQDQGLQLLELEETFGSARFLKGRCPVPLIVRLHGPWFLNGAANGAAQDAGFHKRDHLEKLGILAADAITSPSQDVLDQTRTHFGLALPDAQVIPNPVELVGSANRWKLQDCDRNRIVFIGRFDRHKGGDTMIDAFVRIVQQFPEARLDFVGPDRGCRDDTGRDWEINEYLGQKLNAADRAKVTYHGFQPGVVAAELRKRALVTVAPSRYETFGIATAEAMMAGCPLVVAGSGALTELIQDGRNGLVARVGDAADVGEKVLSLLTNLQAAARLGEQAATDAAQRYAPQVVAAQTAEFYQSVIACAGLSHSVDCKPQVKRRVSVSV